MARTDFRYSLEALLRKRRSDWKTVKLEEVAAARVVDDRHAETERARDGMQTTEQSLRHARRDGVRIDPVHHELLNGYLGHQRVVLHERQQALQQARGVHERVQLNLNGIARAIKSLEKHRAAREAEHRLEQSSLEQRRMDELWLLGWPQRQTFK